MYKSTVWPSVGSTINILSNVLLQVEKPRVVSSRTGEGTTSDSTSGITVDVDEYKQRVRPYYLSTWFFKGSVNK